MGKRIDCVIGWTLLFTAGFATFLYAWRNIYVALACALAFLFLGRVVSARLRGALCGRRSHKRHRQDQAERQVRSWLYMPEDAALDEIAGAVLAANKIHAQKLDSTSYRKKDGGEIRFALIQSHPDGSRTDANQILMHWKANRRAATLVLANTGFFDEKARQYAGRLNAPCISLYDGQALIDAVLRSGIEWPARDADGGPSQEEKKTSRWQAAFARLRAINRRSAWRSALYGGLLMALYFLIGTPTYLILSLVLLALAAMGIHRPKQSSAL